MERMGRVRPLIIDSTAKASIAELCEYAEENPICNKELQARVAIPGGFSPVGENPNHCCNLFSGYKCVFSIEEQNFGWTKHLSISVAADNQYPSLEAVKLIMVEFGIKSPIEECCVYIEDESQAVNIISEI
jgi:hypothetical protein